MKVISHRGYWKDASEKNMPIAFERSFSLNFGTETDFRDLDGSIVISHDMPLKSQSLLTASEMLSMLNGKNLTMAINIKCDGLAMQTKQLFANIDVDWFVFDMSIPDMRQHLNVGNPVYARMSEVEQSPAWIDEVKGVWLDGFNGVWYDNELISNLTKRGLQVCIVSPELHKREHLTLWQMLKTLGDTRNVTLCTDLPEDAQHYFNVE